MKVVGITIRGNTATLAFKRKKETVIDQFTFEDGDLSLELSKKLSELKLRRCNIVLSLPQEHVHTGHIVRPNITKMKNFKQAARAEIGKEANILIKEVSLSYKYFVSDILGPNKMLINYAYCDKAYLDEFLQSLDNPNIYSVDVYPEGIRRVLDLKGYSLILDIFKTKDEQEIMNIFVYRDDILLANRTLTITNFDCAKLNVEIGRTVDSVRNTLRDIVIKRCVIVSELEEITSELASTLDYEHVQTFGDGSKLNSKGLLTWGGEK